MFLCVNIRYNNDELLRSACKRGRYHCVKKLIECGVSIHCTCPYYKLDDLSEEYPLRIASYKGHYEIVQLLVFHGAKVEKLGKNLICYLIDNQKEIAKFLLS